ncbi:hypothetical protein GCM10025864_31120 [Luteimicrobium album]|uniref:Uncharacterized protein n=1 Tax=Luteimicrobium album TaxID=1054550 RepID=A0ABQ6I5E8_9MICO|nr:hypothetical protein GCM10025864_31120 [Luteimicrobium album]
MAVAPPRAGPVEPDAVEAGTHGSERVDVELVADVHRARRVRAEQASTLLEHARVRLPDAEGLDRDEHGHVGQPGRGELAVLDHPRGIRHRTDPQARRTERVHRGAGVVVRAPRALERAPEDLDPRGVGGLVDGRAAERPVQLVGAQAPLLVERELAARVGAVVAVRVPAPQRDHLRYPLRGHVRQVDAPDGLDGLHERVTGVDEGVVDVEQDALDAVGQDRRAHG